MLALLAFLIRFVSTQHTGDSHLPQASDPTWIKVHVYLGYVVLAGIALLVFIGAAAAARGGGGGGGRAVRGHPPPRPPRPPSRAAQAFTNSSCARAKT